jgi:endonuclease/exonuclease/phosphatase family metal-dependent hydrolase
VSAPRGALRVATYNVRAAIGPGPFPDRWWTHPEPERLEQIAAVIATLEPDIVALQEVALLNVDATVQDQATALSQLTEMEVRFGAVRHFALPEPHYAETAHGAGLFGNAILSRLPITDSQVIALPQAPETDRIEPEGEDHPLSGVRWIDLDRPVREPRCLLLATVTLPDGRDLTIGSTHFSHIGSGERRVQAEAVVDALAGSEVAALLGDLNAPIHRRELEPLRGVFHDAFTQVGLPVGDEDRQTLDEHQASIDHILLRGLRATECRVVREAGDASDHWPVVATIRW